MNILYLADFIGIASFALSGFLIANKHKLDILGILLISYLTALGGGIIRDNIAQRLPFSLTHIEPSLIVIGVIILAIIFKVHNKEGLEKKNIFIVSDAIGLVSFSITGALVASEVGLNSFGIVITSLITAVGGGMIRDVLLNEVPSILKHDFYGSVSIIIGIIISILYTYEQITNITISLLFFLSLTLRLYATFKNWHLPSL